jgi:ATP-dependent RNA helicase SUPV3L1/SUV3
LSHGFLRALTAPVPIREIAAELKISQAAARDLAVCENGRPGTPTLQRQRLDELLALPDSELDSLMQRVRSEAPLIRERAKEERRRLAEEKARRQRELEEAEARHEREQVALRQLRERHGIEPARGEQAEVRTSAAAAFLGLSEAQVRTLIRKKHLHATKREVHTLYGWSERYFVDLRALIRAADEQPDWLAASRRRAASVRHQRDERAAAKAARAAQARQAADRERRRAEAALRITVPVRRSDPETVTLHVGPTNSGKTYHALRALISSGEGVYAAPLRLLAREAYERMLDTVGKAQVGLLTGEERINEDAPLLCCTAEMAPLAGQTLVLDETQWAADTDRGSAWTRLLCAGSFQHVHVAAAPDALPLLRRAFPDADLRTYERLNPLTYAGRRNVKRLTPGTAVVAFSRKAVLGLASLIARTGVSVATLYGAMPLNTRISELERFASGEATVLCTTDVIGHGLNVPNLAMVVFAETEKFDGRSRRPLEAWEIAQIAGRAGRHGHVAAGEAAVLSGVRWFEPDGRAVRRALTPTVAVGEGLRGHRAVSRGVLRPRLSDLGCTDASQLPLALRAWVEVAEKRLTHPWVTVDRCSAQRAWVNCLKSWATLEELSTEHAWTLVNAPADPSRDADLFRAMASSVAHGTGQRELSAVVSLGGLRRWSLEETEGRAADIALLRWFVNVFSDHSPVDAEVAATAETRVAEHAHELLRRTVQRGKVGRCEDCHAPCPPWFSHCDSCHSAWAGGWDRDWY